jgi:hypothetical protein
MNRPSRQSACRAGTTIFLRCVTAGFLVLISGTAAHAQTRVRADSLLTTIRNLYEDGSYLSAEVEARRLLDNRTLPDSLRIRAEQYLSFSLVAQAKNAGAIDHFVTILKIDSTYALDSVLTSPKILTVLAEARRQYGIAGPSSALRPQNSQRTAARGVTFRTVVFPGWEQSYHGRTTKGYALIGAGALSLGLTIYCDRERRAAQDEYMAAGTPELAASRYTRYNNFYKAEYYSLGAFIAIYLYSQLDAFFDLPPHLDPAISPSPAGVQVTMHIPL